MNAEVNEGLEQALIQVRDDAEVRVAILTGAGNRAFSVGADLRGAAARTETPRRVVPAAFELMFSLGVRTPIIAAINGYCLAGAFFLACACDIRIASESASFGIPEVTLAMVPEQGVTQWLPQLMPGSIALKYLLTGERFSASDAYRWGLVCEVVSEGNLISAAESIAEMVSNNGPLAVKGAKAAFWGGLRYGMDEGLRLENETGKAAHLSEDAKEGPRAFVEKRKPVYKGK